MQGVTKARIWSLGAVFAVILVATAAHADSAFVGMRVQGITPIVAQGLGIDPPRGVIVRDVAHKGPADQSGIVPGDILLSVAGEQIKDFNRLLVLVSGLPMGEEVPIAVWREGRERALMLSPGKWPKAWQVSKDVDMELSGTGLTIATLTSERRKKYNVRWGHTGLLVTRVEQDSLSFRNGIRPGDLIVAVNQDHVWDPKQIKKKFLQARNRKRDVVVFLVDQPTGRIVLPVAVAGTH